MQHRLSVDDILHLVRLVRGGNWLAKRAEIVHAIGMIVIGLANLLSEQQGAQDVFATEGPLSAPETIDECCQELEAQLSNREAAGLSPFVLLLIRKLIQLLIDELL